MTEQHLKYLEHHVKVLYVTKRLYEYYFIDPSIVDNILRRVKDYNGNSISIPTLCVIKEEVGEEYYNKTYFHNIHMIIDKLDCYQLECLSKLS